MFSSEIVKGKLQSFPNGSGAGGSGFKPQYFKDIIACPNMFMAVESLESITALVNCIAESKAPWAPFLSSVPLIVLSPDYYRNLCAASAQVLLFCVADVAKSFFGLLQVSVVTIWGGGVEASVHVVRQATLELGMDLQKIMLKVEFKNAFLRGIIEHFSGLYRWAKFCNTQPGLLFFGGALLMSELGVQQGDPLGPLLFSFVLHSLVRMIEERVPGLNVHAWFLDDGTIIGDINLMARALGVIEQFARNLRFGG